MNAADLRNQRVLIRCDHNLGDTIQFIRYLPMVQSIARDVVVHLPPALQPLLNVKSEGEHDVEIEVTDLAQLFPAIPCDVPYLHAEPLPLHRDRLHVGIAWHSGGWHSKRDVPFALVEELAQIPAVTLHSLQEEDAGELAETARLIRSLDLVITVDAIPAHLAGALGVPVWTLLHRECDWRWMAERDDSPWYPTMRLYRQRKAGDWSSVTRQLLRDVLAESSRTIASAARPA
jgi:hypothetical protein